MKIKVISTALLLSCCMSYAQVGFGGYDCGQWFVKGGVAKAWLLGYLSGINAMVANENNNYDPLAKLGSAEQAFLWVDNYCKANPLKNLYAAGSELYFELQKK